MYIIISRISVCVFLLLLSLSLARRICPARTPWVTEVLWGEKIANLILMNLRKNYIACLIQI
jgi:hypothetical protein